MHLCLVVSSCSQTGQSLWGLLVACSPRRNTMLLLRVQSNLQHTLAYELQLAED